MTNDITYQNETTTGESERSEGVSKGNPYKVYRVSFPYRVRFTFEDDDHNTEVVINTKSIEYFFGKDEKDVYLQKELSDQISEKSFIRHITNWVRERVWRIEPEEGSLEFTGEQEIHLVSQEEINETEREIISIP